MAFNNKNSGVRRIFKELAEIRMELDKSVTEPGGCFCAVESVNDNLFELHFTIRGPPDTPYELGCYHGKLILPHDYPFKPPEITFLTPSGRFEVKKKLCLSVSDFHPESWQPAWGLRTVLIGISSFMAIESAGAIGSVVYNPEERKLLANESLHWTCSDCKKPNMEILPGAGEKYTVKTIEKDVGLSFAYQKTDEPPRPSTATDTAETKDANSNLPAASQPTSDVAGTSTTQTVAVDATPQEDTAPTLAPAPAPAPAMTPLQNAAALAAIRAQRMRHEDELRRRTQEARTLRSRIDLLIIVLLFAVVFKVVT